MYRIKNSISSLLLLIILSSCNKNKEIGEVLPYYNTPNFTPIFDVSKNDLNKIVPHVLADFSFLNQNGSVITNKTVEGKIHVANFFFTSCGSICPKMTDNMQTISDSFSKDNSVLLLSYSVTPWIDNISVLKKYALNNNITNPNWNLLTGDKSKIYKLARESYFAEESIGFSKDKSEFLHTEHFILVDKNKRIRGIYNGTLKLEIKQLIADIRTLQNE